MTIEPAGVQDCCEPSVAPTPMSISNRPGLSSIDYRVGSYPSFLRSMLDEISRNPDLARWSNVRDDYGIAVLHMWAYLADILTFYQERIANEAFLRTATQRESVLRLARLIDYEPAPGVAAVARLAFTVQRGKDVSVPVGLLVQSVPGQDEKPQKFETVEDMHALASLNELSLVTSRVARARDRFAFFQAGAGGIRPGDYIALLGDELEADPASDRWDVRRVTEVRPGPHPQTTGVSWDRGLGRVWPRAPTSVAPRGYRFRQQAWPFGHDAPVWSPVAKWQAQLLENFEGVEGEWPDEFDAFEDASAKTFPQETAHNEHIYLDSVYPDIYPGSWVALVTHQATDLAPRSFYTELYRVERVTEMVRTAFSITAKVTRLTVPKVPQERDGDTVRQPENIDFFPLQGTSILVLSEPIGPALVPDDRPVEERTLTLAGLHAELGRGRQLVVTGTPTEPEGIRYEGATVYEVALGDDETIVTLEVPLRGSYVRSSVRVFANVTRATHGETVSGEVLGGGDAASALQSFSLKKSPITFVPKVGAPHGAAASLEVRVDGVRYAEVPTLLGRGPKERVFEHTVEPDGTSTVVFGDGKEGAGLPTGRNNVTAEYRVGLGRAGNVGEGSLRTLLERPVGLKGTTNPMPAQGGTDPESLEEARTNAPSVVRTFGRIVSLRDFEDAAREFAGVAKARAAVVWDGEDQVAHLTVAGEDGTQITGDLYDRLVKDLNARRDRNRRLSVVSYRPVYLLVDALIVVDPAYLAEDVVRRCREALAEHFGFGNRDFGQAAHLSDVYAALQAVEGIVAADVNRLDFKPTGIDVPLPSPVVRDHLAIGPSEMAAIERPEDIVVITEDGV
jgi:hypothetical protein